MMNGRPETFASQQFLLRRNVSLRSSSYCYRWRNVLQEPTEQRLSQITTTSCRRRRIARPLHLLRNVLRRAMSVSSVSKFYLFLLLFFMTTSSASAFVIVRQPTISTTASSWRTGDTCCLDASMIHHTFSSSLARSPLRMSTDGSGSGSSSEESESSDSSA